MVPIFSDTVSNVDGGATTWEVIYNRLEDERPKVIVTKETIDSTRPSGLQFKDSACSFLHMIGVSAKILPYMDMIRWVIEKLITKDREFNNSRMELIGSFKPENFKKMYHIPKPQDIYDREFVANFARRT